MKNRTVTILFLLSLVLSSCNLPVNDVADVPSGLETGSGASQNQSMATGTPTPFTSPGNVPEGNTATNNMPDLALAPPDLPFYIDCSALDPSRQADCDTFIANTRDLVYPLLRELTGTSLTDCYDAVFYTILADNPISGAVGIAEQNIIQMSQEATIDFTPNYDAHELFHTFDFCNGALDYHVFHSAFENEVYRHLFGQDRPGGGRESATYLLETLQTEVKTITEPGKLVDPCRGIMVNLVTTLYYDLGFKAIQQLYQATINPGPEAMPNDRLYMLYGPQGNKFQALLNTLEGKLDYPIDVPECGF